MGRGHGGPGGDAGTGEPPDQVGQHGRLAAVEMGGAAGVDQQPVGRIGRHHGRVELQRPARQTLEGGCVLPGIGIVDQQAGDERLGLGGGHAGTEPERRGRPCSRR